MTVQNTKNKVIVPSLYGNREIVSTEFMVLNKNTLTFQISKASRSLQNLMCNKAEDIFYSIQETRIDKWLDYFRGAGENLKNKIETLDSTLTDVLYKVSLSSGIPSYRLKKAYLSLAMKMIDMPEILKHQNLTNELTIFDKKGFIHRSWKYIPRASTVAIQVPGNYPTINITWLTALAMKRPVLLSTSLKDPLTPFYLAKLLFEEGIPNHSISIVCNDFTVFAKRGGQRLIYDEMFSKLNNDVIALQTKQYHKGQSKLVLLRQNKINFYKIASMIMQGSGRLCTNPSSILVTNNESDVAKSLAKEINKYKIYGLQDEHAIVPAFDNHTELNKINKLIKDAILEGAIDMSEYVTKQPLIIEKEGNYFLRPTVLLVDIDHSIYGKELPFPFVTVSKCEKKQIPIYCKFSLIVSLIGNCFDLYNKLIYEPTIDKVFSENNFDRGYNVYDAHEEHLLDFLFKKKTIC